MIAFYYPLTNRSTKVKSAAKLINYKALSSLDVLVSEVKF